MKKEFDLPVIYNDEHLLVINKPVDLPVHKNDFMPHDAPYLTKLAGDLTGKWILNVHRLDSKTSGLIVLAFSKEVAHELILQFERREVAKIYNAIVQGNPGEGTFDKKVLVKKKGKFKKPAITHYRTLQTVSTNISYKEKKDINLSLVEINPVTGRWHQLRQHFAQNHHDILGDSHHGDFTLNKIVTDQTGVKRLFLHASGLGFVHPVSKEKLKFKADIPDTFDVVLNHEWIE